MCAILKKTNKAVSLILCLLLLSQNFAFAQQAVNPKTQEEIKLMLSKPDKYIQAGLGENCAWLIAVLAVGAVAYKAGHFIGDIRGFSRGFHAAGNQESRRVLEKQTIFMSKMEKEMAALQRQIVKTSAAGKAENDAIMLIVRLNSQIGALKQKRLPYETENIKKSIEKTIQELASLEFKDPLTKRTLGKFLDQASKSISKKGIILSITSVLAASAAFVLLSGTEDKHPISSARLAVKRQLAQAVAVDARAFFIKALMLKQQYGLELVSSVIYENQPLFCPALEQQLSVIENADNRMVADLLLDSPALNKPAENKGNLLESLKTPKPLKYSLSF